MEGHSMDCSLMSSGLSVGPEAQPAMGKTSNNIKITLNIDVPLLNIPNTQDMFNRNLPSPPLKRGDFTSPCKGGPF